MGVHSLIRRVQSRLSRAPGHLLWPPLNIGHRGAAGEAPENTLAAFELALRQGADGVEFDVRLSADGMPMVIHDARLERTTSGSGWVGEHRASALRRLNAGSWFNRRFPLRARERYAGARIPFLSEVLGWARDHKCRALVEIKEPAAVAKVVKEIEAAGLRSLAMVISFDLPTLRRARQLDPEIVLGMDISRPAVGRLVVRRAKSLRAGALLPHWAIATRRSIRRAHRNSLQVFAWAVDQPRWMRRKILDGVDGLLTNYPARLTEVRARLAKP